MRGESWGPQGPVYAGEGCPRCGKTGFYERSGVFETLEMNDRIRELIVGHATHGDLRNAAIEGGMRTLQQAGCDAVDAGRTTIAEVMRTVYVI